MARDTLPMTLPPFSRSDILIVGAETDVDPDAFFTGLIDDVRIYNRVARP